MSDSRSGKRKRSGLRALVFMGALGAALCVWASPGASGPLAGSSILNTASGTGVHAWGGPPFAQLSNTVRAVVQPLESVGLVDPRTAGISPGLPFAFAHRLTNSGNDTFDFRIDAANATGDAFDAIGLTLVQDRNGNGAQDAGDTPIALGGVITLGPGASADLLLAGSVPISAPGSAVAWITLSVTGLAQGAYAENVDTLVTPSVTAAPVLEYFTAADYLTSTRFGTAGQPLYAQAIAPGWDVRPAAIDSAYVTFASQRAGDSETYLAIETAPASGVFRVTPAAPTAPAQPTSTISTQAVILGDATVTVTRGDVVAATAVPTSPGSAVGGLVANAQIWIDPGAVAFDSRDDRAVAGTSVTLIDVTGQGNGGAAGAPARVWARDGVTAAPATIVTGASGAYEFALVPASTYRFDVVPAPGYRFPSTIAPAQLPPDRLVDAIGSYGSAFVAADSLAPIVVDVPLDNQTGEVLFVEKTAQSPYVELGEALDYEVKVANRADVPLDSVVVIDRLPEGFAYVKGTAREDGVTLADPAGGGGPELTFALGTFAAGQTRTLRYRVRVGAGALDGDGVNRAWAARGTLVSNVASAQVDLVPGVFATDATVLGTVYVDLDGDGRLGPGDPGMPGVRLYLDDGSFSVTDADGRYSLYGISPRTHALKVDGNTLPLGARAISCDAREAGSNGIAFVDPTNGDLYRADWRIPGDSTLADIARARRLAGAPPAEVELGREIALGGTPLDPRRAEPDARSLPANAITTGEGRLPLFPRVPEGGGHAAPDSGIALRPAPAALPPADSAYAALGPALGFVDLAARDTLASGQASVRVKGPFGAAFHLTVSGNEVPAARVGRKSSAPGAGVEVWEYVGVNFAPGDNALVLTADLPDGTHPAPARATVVAPDRPGSIEIDAPRYVPADGFSPAEIELRLVDARGVPVATRTLVMVEATLGRLAGADLDPRAAGLQVAVEGGRAHVTLYAQGVPGIADIRVTGGGLEGHTRVEFVPDLRPFLAVGAFEAQLGLSGRTSGAGGAQLKHPGPAFEAPIEMFVSQSGDGGQWAAAHGAMFLKGRVREDVLLTIGYDSDRPDDLRRLRDIQPDAFYPLYGDASVKGYEARSTNNLYARVDRRGTSLMYGDFVTPGAGGGRALAAYSRSLSGGYGKYEGGRVRFDAWSSCDHEGRVVDELRGRGVSGPYRVSKAPFIENSERVEIVVRDRNQPAIVRSTSARQRFVDYEIDHLTGEILMRSPVPSLDGDLNPIYLRVTYEVDQGGEPFWVSGLEARVRVSDALEVGGSYVDDHDPAGASELRSVFAGVKLGPASTFEAEFAGSNAAGVGHDDAGRFEWRHMATGVEARVYGASTGANFANATSGYAPGRLEAGGKLSLALSPRTRLLSEAIVTGPAGSAAKRGGLLLAFERQLDSKLRVELGTRLSGGAEDDTTDDRFQATVRAKVTAQLPATAGANAYLEYEQDTRDAERKMVALGGEYRFTARGRAYARHELISSLLGPYALEAGRRQHATVIGVDANLTPDARLFSEYRADGVFGAREGEAAIGLANTWKLPSGARINGSLERVQPMGTGGTNALAPGTDPTASATMAATIAVDYARDPRWKGSARIEFRTSRASDGILSTLAGAYRLGRAWSALGRSQFTLMDESSGPQTLRERMQVGFAYRPGPGWDALGRYELRYESSDSGATAGLEGLRLANILSLHGGGPLGDKTTAALAWAGKLAHDGSDGVNSNTSAHWLHGRAAWALAPRWDAGLTASLHAGSGVRRPGVGAEVGRRLQPGVWLSAGYNLTGYADDELTGEEWTRQGVYLRIRARFDETLWTRPAGDAPAGDAAAQEEAR